MQSSFNLIETWIELVNVCERITPLGKQKKKVKCDADVFTKSNTESRIFSKKETVC